MEKDILERANQWKRARYVVRLVRAWGESIRKESRLPVDCHHIPLLEIRCLFLSPALRSNAGMASRQGDVDLRFAQVSAPS